ncbi:recombinase family protein [Adhaeretor mobilis]|uniref:Resolvase/invertase-type recombinase catalytic domain-containing protein n=1 Tax=Adhaeretor mobilis TaxID=1930276 RepID=A0A517MQM7_9BACT|nr:recombinase family protein [Adhaeretor mobilis]QDS97186.1 hypothetical protein HG15A2_04460 [Adhaeretor mobilis]
MMFLDPPLAPKNGHTLQVITICRASSPGEGKQDIRSLGDQEQLLRQWLEEHYKEPTEITVFADSGSGERLDRQETIDAHSAIETGRFDLVLAEDLGRIMRRTQALDFCENAEDYSTRVISLNDSDDSGREGWRMSAFFAAMRHELYKADTGKRIRRTLRNRFESGGVVQTVIFGYIKPPGTEDDSQLQKDPEAETIYDEWFTRLENGETFSAIADWLNENEVPTGPHSRRSTWFHTWGHVTPTYTLEQSEAR